jgi:hypothetical protein
LLSVEQGYLADSFARGQDSLQAQDMMPRDPVLDGAAAACVLREVPPSALLRGNAAVEQLPHWATPRKGVDANILRIIYNGDIFQHYTILKIQFTKGDKHGINKRIKRLF